MNKTLSFNPIRYLILTALVTLLVTTAPSAAASRNQAGRANLRPFHHHGPQISCLVSLSCEKSASNLMEIAGNVVLFLPFGMLFGVVLLRRRHHAWLCVLLVFGAGLLFSISIEAVQFWHPTRYTDVDDVILNSGGALLGGLLTVLLHGILTTETFRRPAENPIPLRRR